MSTADLAPLPWELERAPLTSADEYAAQPAYAATYHADRHVADPALRAKHEHTEAARARDNVQRRADAVRKGYAAPCAVCESLTRTMDAARTPAGAVLCAVCAPTITESAAPAVSTPSAPVAPAPAERPVAAERGAVPALQAGVELKRLAAAVLLTAERIGEGQYRVTGGAGVHEVDLGAEGAASPRCTCGDAVWRGAYHCKHVVRCLAERNAPADASLVAAFAIVRGLYARGAVLAAAPATLTPAKRAA
jgi:hypothetical protein